MLLIVESHFIDKGNRFCWAGTAVLVAEVTCGSQDAEAGDALM